jgi:hypothetical protein
MTTLKRGAAHQTSDGDSNPEKRVLIEPCTWLTHLHLHKSTPGLDPTVYNGSVVNFYNATGSLACFENKNIFF